MSCIRYLLTVFLIVLLPGLTLAQETLWVSSTDAALKAEKSASSRTITRLPVGTKLNVVCFEKRWYRVFTDSGYNGWIYRGKVSEQRPAHKGDGDFIVELTDSSIKGEEMYSARSLRGAQPSESVRVSAPTKEYVRALGIPQAYQNALYQVLTLDTEADEIERFLKTGKIGEYAQ